MKDSDLSPEQRREAVLQGRYQTASTADEGAQAWIYADRVSVAPGERLRIFTSTNLARYRVTILKDGQEPQIVWRSGEESGIWQEAPADCSVSGCNWRDCLEIVVPVEWPSGGYRLHIEAWDPGGRRRVESDGLVLIRPTPETLRYARDQGRLLLVASTCTWWAYNSWGGSNHYDGICGPDGNACAPVVSLDRPYDRGFVTLPPDAPRIRLDAPPAPDAPLRYPHMEWAWRTGHSRKYASSGWASYERLFLLWAERAGIAVDIVAQSDLEDQPDILSHYRCVCFVGHDEYWTWGMRDVIDSYVEAGGKVARFAGNFLWQCRLDASRRRQTCYKYDAEATDPMARSDTPWLTTTAWEAPIVGRSGALTFGLEATWGIYAGWGRCGARGVRGFPLYRPEHWVFAGTGLGYGDLLGEPSGAFGYETDGLDYIIRNGLPEPAPGSAAPDGLRILGLGLAMTGEPPGREENPDFPAFIGDMETRFVARLRHGSDSPEACAESLRGNGMIVQFPKGQGEVFHSGSCNWVAGLRGGDPAVERVTATVLKRYLSP